MFAILFLSHHFLSFKYFLLKVRVINIHSCGSHLRMQLVKRSLWFSFSYPIPSGSVCEAVIPRAVVLPDWMFSVFILIVQRPDCADVMVGTSEIIRSLFTKNRASVVIPKE